MGGEVGLRETEEGSRCKRHSLADGSSWQDERGPLRTDKLEG